MFQLKQLGYTNIDGLDFAQKMIDLCKSKSLFNDYICASIEPDKKVPQIADGKFLMTSARAQLAAASLALISFIHGMPERT